jgi:phospholipid/cholesterol/gamma-HCH transport system permease protein
MKGVADRVAAYVFSVAASVLHVRMLANPMVRLVFLRQIYFTAVRSLRLISIVALVIGTAFVWQVTEVLGNDPRLFELVERVLMQNTAPLAAAIIVIGRSATAMSTELAYMHCNGEVVALRHLRISAHDYLVVPRVAAVTLATVGCCFYSQVVAVVGGFAASAMILDVSLADQLHRFAERVSIPSVALGVLKAACFGWFIAIVACSVGLDPTRDISHGPVAPAQAFLGALLAVLTINVVFLFVL